MIGRIRSSPVTIPVTVVDSLTTAIAGTHYNLLTNSVTIAPGDSLAGNVQVEVLAAATSTFPGPNAVVTFRLGDNDAENVRAARRVRDYRLTIVR